jgi:hypothetical protein
LNPEVVNIFGLAARYCRDTVDSSHDDAQPDNSSLHTGKNYYFPLHISRVVLLLLRQRRGTTGIAPGATAKYPRRTTGAAAGNGPGTTLNYLHGAAGF